MQDRSPVGAEGVSAPKRPKLDSETSEVLNPSRSANPPDSLGKVMPADVSIPGYGNLTSRDGASSDTSAPTEPNTSIITSGGHAPPSVGSSSVDSTCSTVEPAPPPFPSPLPPSHTTSSSSLRPYSHQSHQSDQPYPHQPMPMGMPEAPELQSIFGIPQHYPGVRGVASPSGIRRMHGMNVRMPVYTSQPGYTRPPVLRGSTPGSNAMGQVMMPGMSSLSQFTPHDGPPRRAMQRFPHVAPSTRPSTAAMGLSHNPTPAPVATVPYPHNPSYQPSQRPSSLQSMYSAQQPFQVPPRPGPSQSGVLQTSHPSQFPIPLRQSPASGGMARPPPRQVAVNVSLPQNPSWQQQQLSTFPRSLASLAVDPADLLAPFTPLDGGQTPEGRWAESFNSLSIPDFQPSPVPRAWHQEVDVDLRKHLVRKYVEDGYYVKNVAALQDPQRIRLYVINAMNKEKTAFNMSGSKEEYFQLLAERIYQRRIGLEEQRKLMRTGITGLPDALRRVVWGVPRYIHLPEPQLPKVKLPWHLQLFPRCRECLVRELLNAIYPKQDPPTLQDPRMDSLVTYAMNEENVIFNRANCKDEYYQLVAEKVVLEQIKLKNEEEEKHLAALKDVMAAKGSLDQTIMHCLLFGYPGAGKSSLMNRLTGHLPNPTLPSTGVAERAVQVEIRRLTTTTAMALRTESRHGVVSKWCILSYDDEAIALMSSAAQGITAQPTLSPDSSPAQPTASPDLSPIEPTPSKEAVGGASNQPVLIEDSDPMDSPTCTACTSKSVVEGETPFTHDHIPPMEVLKQAIKRKGLKGVERYLQRSLTLYLTDTGGQLEFQELLPALTAGPTLFFVVFRLDQDMNETFSIQFRYPDGHSSEPYQSSFTVRETLLQSLASIASMGSYVYSKKNEEQILLKPKVLFIGTHCDKVSSETVKKIDCNLREMVMATSLFREGLIERVSESQLMVAINNLSPDDSQFQLIQSIVERIAVRDNFRVSLPSTWLIFSLIIRQLKKRIITHSECFAIAQQCGIDSINELNEALWFLNTKVGLVRHFRGEGLEDLQDIVIVDPQILFSKITQLMLRTFSDHHFSANICEDFKSKGIFPINVLEQINSEDDKLLTVSRFVKLLEHLHIISRLHTKEVKYFMPCTLAHAQCTAPEFTHSSSAAPSMDAQQIPPLLITFKCGYCPKGLFSAMVVYLLGNKMKSEVNWRLQTDCIFRNAISFLVGPYDTTTLTVTPMYLEVAMRPAEVDGERRLSVKAVCTEVRCCIEAAVREVTSTLHYTSDAEHVLAFYCTGDHVISPERHPAEISKFRGDPCTILCEQGQHVDVYKLPSGYEHWFTKGLYTVLSDGTLPFPAVMQPPELTVFVEKRFDIRRGILSSVQHGIASRTYARGLISEGVHRTVTDPLNAFTADQRTDIFLNELESRIRNDPRVLRTFIEVLRHSDAVHYAALIRTITEALENVIEAGIGHVFED